MQNNNVQEATKMIQLQKKYEYSYFMMGYIMLIDLSSLRAYFNNADFVKELLEYVDDKHEYLIIFLKHIKFK
jgi:translation elongation factor P/translation initiation factor 5A